jgi:hypothetical protein
MGTLHEIQTQGLPQKLRVGQAGRHLEPLVLLKKLHHGGCHFWQNSVIYGKNSSYLFWCNIFATHLYYPFLLILGKTENFANVSQKYVKICLPKILWPPYGNVINSICKVWRNITFTKIQKLNNKKLIHKDPIRYTPLIIFFWLISQSICLLVSHPCSNLIGQTNITNIHMIKHLGLN